MSAEEDAWAAQREQIRDALATLTEGSRSRPRPHRVHGPVTSDLSIDESLILHSIGWEPLDLVCGAGVYSIGQGSWQWGVGEIQAASSSVSAAFETAGRNLEGDARVVGGHGVVGVNVEVGVERHVVRVVLTGTAVAPQGEARGGGSPFVSDLSARDFALLHNAGWEPLGLAYGASYVHVPRRSAGVAMAQSTQNVELTNFTEAMYSAREAAMERMQASAISQRASGVVAVHVYEGPMEFASHAIGFTAWGTSVRRSDTARTPPRARVVVSVDDPAPAFDAAALRGG